MGAMRGKMRSSRGGYKDHLVGKKQIEMKKLRLMRKGTSIRFLILPEGNGGRGVWMMSRGVMVVGGGALDVSRVMESGSLV